LREAELQPGATGKLTDIEPADYALIAARDRVRLPLLPLRRLHAPSDGKSGL
jgi:hypothetical protein